MPPSTTGRIFHLVTATDATATATTTTTTAATAATTTLANDQFERHGFVHCCFREQLPEIAAWWFDDADDLVALELDPTRLTAPLRLEASPTRWYPHLYGPIDEAAVIGRHPIEQGHPRRLPRAFTDPPPGYQLTGVVDGTEATVRWFADGTVSGDAAWRRKAVAAIDRGATVELLGGVHVPATLDRAYESFALLQSVVDGGRIARYDGDGFF